MRDHVIDKQGNFKYLSIIDPEDKDYPNSMMAYVQRIGVGDDVLGILRESYFREIWVTFLKALNNKKLPPSTLEGFTAEEFRLDEHILCSADVNDYINIYHDNRFKHFFGLSIVDFMKLTLEDITILKVQAQEIMRKATNRTEEELDALKGLG